MDVAAFLEAIRRKRRERGRQRLSVIERRISALDAHSADEPLDDWDTRHLEEARHWLGLTADADAETCHRVLAEHLEEIYGS